MILLHLHVMTILVVDDDALVIDVFESMLKSQGHEVVGDCDPATAAPARRRGMGEVLRKPFRPHELFDVIDRASRNRPTR